MDPSKPESFNHRTEELFTGRTYHFIDQRPDGYNPATTITLLLVHGFPDLWYAWRYQIGPWVKAGYRVVVPDMLGYGGTDKPKEAIEYTTKKLSNDLAALLDLIGVQKAVVIGHDWGSFVTGRFALWHPDRLLGLVFLSIAFSTRSSVIIPLEEIVKRFPNYGYQIYFADESSTKEIEANLETFLKVLHSDLGPDGAQITTKGALRPYVLGDVPFKSGTLLSDEELNYYLSQFDSMQGPLSYYRTTELRFEEENASNLSGELGPDIPVMFIRGIRDPTSPAIAAQRMEQLVPHMKKISVDAGHWLMIETKQQVIDGVLTWLGEVNLKAKL